MIEEALETFLQNLIQKQIFNFNSRILVAYSGGVDSHVLLHALANIRKLFPEIQLNAIHIHHGLLPGADAWAEHCKNICAKLSIDFQVVNVAVKCEKGDSIEEAARHARYAAFAQLIHDEEFLLAAHHADDQAETCLLQFLRGAGLKGLAAMPKVMSFANGFIARPFLEISRQQVLTYAKQNNLSWIEDDSNHDLRFTRNFLRYSIMPEFRNRWPSINKTIMRVASNCAEANDLLKEVALQDIETIKGEVENTLAITKLCKFSLVRQKNILREWLNLQAFRLPSMIKLQHVISDVINAAQDAEPCVKWQGVEIHRYQDQLYAIKELLPFDNKISIEWDCKENLELPFRLGVLNCKESKGKGLTKKKLHQQITIKFRQGGEVCKLTNRQGSHKLKKLFQEWNIPPWQRDRIPLIYVDDKLAMIVGHAICEGFAAEKNEDGLLVWN